MKGIDISAWQEKVNWQAVVASGIEFVIVKMGQSGRLDSMFIDHVNRCVEYGLKFGVYVYSKATGVEEAKEEARWVAEQISVYLNGSEPELGIWFDMEDESCRNGDADVTDFCNAFIGKCNELGFTYVGVYSSLNWLENVIDISRLVGVPIWCAQYNSECNFTGRNLRIWQFTDSFIIDGQNFDGNEYYE